MQDPEDARIYDAGLTDRASLSEVDRRRFDAMVSMWFGGWHQEFEFSVDGVIAPSVWETRKRTMRMFFRQPGMRQCLSEYREIYGEEFGDFVDGLIREGEAAE